VSPRAEQITQPADAIRERLERLLERLEPKGLSCRLCYRAEVVAQIASENPGWSRLRVELFVDELLATPAWENG
jgi:hypothetical protein